MKIDVFHDTVCPWCRIGKQQLKNALAQWDGTPVTVEYHPFFLNESIPLEGADFRRYMAAKGGSDDIEFFFDAPRRAGAAVGLRFNFEAIQYAPNTLLSHRLIELAPQNLKETMIDALYKAYFENGLNIGDLSTLVQIAGQNGLDAETIARQLHGDDAREAVLTKAHEAQRMGVSGVPLFVFQDQYALSGAQPASKMLGLMRQLDKQEVMR